MANLVLINPQTAKTFKGSGGDVTFTPKNVANGAGRMSARGDLWGTTKGSRCYRLYAELKPGATPTIGNTIDIYVVRWNDDSTPGQPDGQAGSTDAAISSTDSLRNLLYVGSLQIQAASSSVVSASWVVEISTRYASVAVWNASGAALTNVDADHLIKLTPIPDEIQ